MRLYPECSTRIDPRLFRDTRSKKADGKRSMSSDTRSSSSSTREGRNSESDEDGVHNNHNVEVSPDMSAALVWQLLDTCGQVSDEQRSLGLEADNPHNNPMKERAFHAKQL